MNQAGTAPEYLGLFETIRGFAVPSAEELSSVEAALPERAEVGHWSRPWSRSTSVGTV